jgi:hypothetical protein
MTRHLLPILLFCSLTGLLFLSCGDDPAAPGGDIGMDEALDIVKEDVLPAAVPDGGQYICLAMSGSIPKGSTIEEDVPGGMKTSMTRSSYVSNSVDKESYFFFLDLDPHSFYEHPVKYILVEKSGGAFSVDDAQWWPKINGRTPSQFLATVPESTYIVDSNVELAPVDAEMTFQIPDLSLIWKEGFIVVQGLMPDDKCYECAVNTYQNGLNFFNAYKNSFSRVEGLTEAQADNVPAVIDDMAEEGIDLITIYIIAHGSVNSIDLAGHGVSVTTFRNKMAEHPDVLFNFMLGSCHGGSFIDDLETLDNVRVVMTACATDEGAQVDWDYADGLADYNAIDSGSEWTSSVLWAANVITLNREYFSIVEDWAGTYHVPVTCELLYYAHYGAIGLNSGMNLYYNLDLSYRVDKATPQISHSWSPLK